MANGDFDPEDLNPPGTMTAVGLSPDDPLYDWGSNIHPSQLQQYMHDPDEFKNRMAQQGIAPPKHEYTGMPDGSLQATDPDSGKPVYRSASAASAFGPVQDPSQGNLTGGALAYQDIPEQPGEQGENPIAKRLRENAQRAGEAKPYPPGQDPTVPPLLRPVAPRPAPAPAPTPAPTMQRP